MILYADRGLVKNGVVSKLFENLYLIYIGTNTIIAYIVWIVGPYLKSEEPKGFGVYSVFQFH